MNTLFIIGIFLSFFLQFLLLSKKNQSVPDRILAVWMFIFGIHLFSFYIYSLGYWDRYPHLVGVTHPLPLLHGPMLYLYIVYSLKPDQKFTWRFFAHFIPFVLSYLYMIRFFFFYSAEQKVMVNHGEVNDFSIFMGVSLIAFCISGIIYPLLSYRMLGQHRRLINENYAYEEFINLNWLKYCIWGIGVIYLVAALSSILREGLGLEVGINLDMVIYSFVIGFIFLLGYFGIRQQGIFTDVVEVDKIAETAGEYRRSGLKEEDAGFHHSKLLGLMNNKKPYLEPKLTLNMLAGELDISLNHLSQVINQHEDKNFYDFVNGYRVEEFKKRVSDRANSNYSILAIAFDSGFNSKSSFNSVFKRISGETPSDYIRKSTQ
ncbi:MAG: helix-turn-helix domain-containing protein [Balneolales bacterium]